MIAAIIPARLASTRLPRKALRDIHGKPLIQHVYESARKSDLLDEIYVATPDEEIVDAVNKFGGKAILTGKHETMLGRCSEAAEHLALGGYTKAIIVQGDEPMVRYEMIDLATRTSELATCLYKRIGQNEDPWNPNMIKVIFDTNHYYIYFSRSVIPGVAPGKNSVSKSPLYKMVGIMCFETQFLARFNRLERGPIEKSEGIDHLRYLEHGYKAIRAIESPYETQCVDTQEDLELVREMMA